MAKFIYTARSSPDQIIQGEIEAETKQDAIQRLARLNQFPISIAERDLASERRSNFRIHKISSVEIAMFTRQLANLLGSGINVVSSLSNISTQTSNKHLKEVILNVITRIKDGKSLSESLSDHPDVFPALYTAMINSGELGGSLELTLKRLADFLEDEEEFRSSIRSALTYPLFVLMVGILTIGVLLGFVIPKLVGMFEDMGQALPLPTRILIGLSGFLCSWWWLILIILVIGIFAFNRIIKTQTGKLSWDTFKLKLFFMGEIILKSELGRWMRTLSLLLSGGIAILSSLEISVFVIGNSYLKSEVEKLVNELSQGESLSKAMKGLKVFPEFVTSIVAMGEETGSLDQSLLRISDSYEKDVGRTLKILTRMLEPVIILVMGLIVGFIVISMLLPIFQINLMVK